MGNIATISILIVFICIFIFISFLSRRNASESTNGAAEDFVIGGRSMGTIAKAFGLLVLLCGQSFMQYSYGYLALEFG